MRGAELALHLPQEVGELGSGANPVDQRDVPLEHGLPVDVGHLRIPELIALEAPRLRRHLYPLGARIDLDAQAGHVHPAGLASNLIAA